MGLKLPAAVAKGGIRQGAEMENMGGKGGEL